MNERLMAHKTSKTLAMPWDVIDDKIMKTQGYTVNFPPSIHAKLKFLGQNEPGCPSNRQMVLEAMESYIAERLKKHI